MHKVRIDAPVDYVCGHLRYGFYNGIIELDDEDFKNFKEDPITFIYEHGYKHTLDFIVEDYEIDDIGSIYEVNWEEEEA